MADAAGPTCFIHVGPHKTGSSSLKHFFRDNLAALDAHGLFFPMLRDEAGRPARNHMELATVDEIKANGDLRPRARLWPEIDEVARRGEKNILLSSEMFTRSLDDRQAFERILTFFERRGYRVVVLAYIRDQPAWLNSWHVHSQRRFAFLETFDEFIGRDERLDRVDPVKFLRKFIDEPRCGLEIVPFERAVAAGLELDFIRRCGVPADASLIKSDLRNPNAGAKSVFAAQEVMRRVGDDLQDLPGFISVCSGFKQRFIDLGWERTPCVMLTEENVARIRAHYARTNERFARRHFGMSWAELCPPKAFRTSTFEPADASWWERLRIERLVRQTAAKFDRLKAEAAAANRGTRAKAARAPISA